MQNTGKPRRAAAQKKESVKSRKRKIKIETKWQKKKKRPVGQAAQAWAPEKGQRLFQSFQRQRVQRKLQKLIILHKTFCKQAKRLFSSIIQISFAQYQVT